MKILFVTNNFPPKIGGMGTYAYEVVSRSSYKYETVVVCPKESKNVRAGLARIIPCFSRYSVSRETIALFIQILKKEKPDLIHFLGASCSFLSLFAKYISGKPVIVTCHGVDFLNPWGTYYFSSNVRKLMKIGLSFCDRIITVSHYSKRQLVDLGIRKGRIKIIFNGVDAKIFRPKRPTIKVGGINNNDRVLLTVSRIDSRKGIGTVIKSLKEILKVEPNLKYIIVGSMECVPDAFIREKVLLPYLKTMGLEKNVIYIGRVPNIEILAEYYNLCDIFIMVPEEIKKRGVVKGVEGFGIVFLEANACGKPVVASKSGGIADAVIHGKTGILVKQKNVKETARAVIKLLQNENLRTKMGLYGKIRVEKYFSWDRNVQQLNTAYKGCPNRHNKKRLRTCLKNLGFLNSSYGLSLP